MKITGKIRSKYIRLYPVFNKKIFEFNKNKGLFPVKNSGNYVHDYAHFFFGKDF